MNMVYKALTNDILTRYIFGKSTNYMTSEDYNRAYFETFENLFEYVHWLLHIGWLGSLLEALPLGIGMKTIPGIANIIKLRQVNWVILILINEIS